MLITFQQGSAFYSSEMCTWQDMVDLYNYLLRNRIIYVGSRITDEVRTLALSWSSSFLSQGGDGAGGVNDV